MKIFRYSINQLCNQVQVLIAAENRAEADAKFLEKTQDERRFAWLATQDKGAIDTPSFFFREESVEGVLKFDDNFAEDCS